MTHRHLDALDYAINKIKKSPLLVYINDLILYGSCARGEEKFGSDVDLLLCLNEEARAYSREIRALKSEVSTSNASDPEVDLHVAFGDHWKTDDSLYFRFIRKEGISVWG